MRFFFKNHVAATKEINLAVNCNAEVGSHEMLMQSPFGYNMKGVITFRYSLMVRLGQIMFLLVLLGLDMAYAQSTNISRVFKSNFEKAEQLYTALAYRNALELYLAVLEKDSSNLIARQHAADCYLRLNNIEDAERMYASLAHAPGALPRHLYQYAEILSMRGKYEQAHNGLLQYQAACGDLGVTAKLDFLKHIGYYYRDSLLYTITNEPFNSEQSDFAPQYYPGGSVFVSARDRAQFIKYQSASALNANESTLNIYFAPLGSKSEREAAAFDKRSLNSQYHDGPIAFYDGNSKATFSRNNVRGSKPVVSSGRVNLKLYFGEVDRLKGMRNIQSFDFNDDTYSISHPWISSDGKKLYFASNKRGGEGGTDIYFTEKKNGKWTRPLNVGPNINTPGDEYYPFLAGDSVLYFSSTGHGGLGGLDIYRSKLSSGVFSAPENLGFPLNTSSDDFSFVLDDSGRSGMFSSNRQGGVGSDDIYSFTGKSFFVKGRIVGRNDSIEQIAGARINVIDDSGLLTDSAYSDTDGYFHVDLDFDKVYHFSVAKKGFTWIDSLVYSTRKRAIGSDSIVLPLWRNALFAKGFIYSNESQEKLSGATITLRNLSDGTIDSVVTNPSGNYDFSLLPNKKYVINAVKDGFLPHEFNLNTTGITQGDLLNDMVLEEEFLEKIVLRFDFEKWEIKSQFLGSLDKIAKFLKRNKKYQLHVSAYADSHGGQVYNLDLSNKRAGEVVNYMLSRGIDRSRITAVGFGEELLLNQCSNGVVCPEIEHAKNRRAELKIQLTR
jgi:outer membrane protein OmpA-like peptidoglycan-associated protein/tetratricopeptide (TPR) repeat protein